MMFDKQYALGWSYSPAAIQLTQHKLYRASNLHLTKCSEERSAARTLCLSTDVALLLTNSSLDRMPDCPETRLAVVELTRLEPNQHQHNYQTTWKANSCYWSVNSDMSLLSPAVCHKTLITKCLNFCLIFFVLMIFQSFFCTGFLQASYRMQLYFRL